VIYTGQGRARRKAIKARNFGLQRLAQIREMVAAHPDKFELATKPEDAARIKAAGKRVVYISIENAYPLSEDPSLIDAYYTLGVRMLGLVHTATTTSPIRPPTRRGRNGTASARKARRWWRAPTSWAS
jgi:membrane dipeptidase